MRDRCDRDVKKSLFWVSFSRWLVYLLFILSIMTCMYPHPPPQKKKSVNKRTWPDLTRQTQQHFQKRKKNEQQHLFSYMNTTVLHVDGSIKSDKIDRYLRAFSFFFVVVSFFHNLTTINQKQASTWYTNKNNNNINDLWCDESEDGGRS